ncbi:MAG: ABC transporter permease [Ardenticatenaceae bacterium]|nr:ABC transporter permease [Ardenticatenaceae bacterium]
MKRLRRITAFLAKEVLDVMRQPRLVLVLILGPFLILLLFGLGFTGKQAPVPVILVIPEGAQLPPDLANRTWNFGPDFPVRGVTSDEQWARSELATGTVEVVAILPHETYSTLLAGRQITIRLLINAIDPVRRDYVTFVANFFVTDLNKQLVRRVAEEGQRATERLRDFSSESLDDLILLADEVEGGRFEQAVRRLEGLINDTTYTAGTLESTDSLLTGLIATLGLQLAPDELARLQEARQRVLALRGELESLKEALVAPAPDIERYRRQLEQARDTLHDLEGMAALFRQIPPDVLIAPLSSTTENISRFNPTYVGFYAPSVLALLIQHIAITFAALSLVRDRLQGVNELFQVSPVSPAEVLTGKFLSYLLLTLALGLVLTLLILRLLKVPLYGDPLLFVLVLGLEIAAALGWGFLISAVSQRESQAVQLSMIVLLAAVFFSGFFLNLSGLRREVLPISYALPVTYAIASLQQIMLAGRLPVAWHLAALGGLALLLTLLAWLIYRRQFRLA